MKREGAEILGSFPFLVLSFSFRFLFCLYSLSFVLS